MLQIHNNKTLKLTNVLSQVVPQEGLGQIGLIIEQQTNYLKNHGAQPIGPVIQYTKPEVDAQGQLQVSFKLLRQANTFLHHVEPPYTMEALLRIPNCMYVRFAGKESDMHFAYEKIGVTAYEEGIKLKGDSYTVLVGQQDDILTADIFMPRADHDN